MKRWLAAILVSLPLTAVSPLAVGADYPVKLDEPLKFHDERVEVTDFGTLRRRYRVWGDFPAELAAWKARAQRAAPDRQAPPRTFRLGCVFLKDAEITCPDVNGADGQPLRATYSTPDHFAAEMRTKTAQQYADFTYAFTGGAVQCQWVFETVAGLKWSQPGNKPHWGCQAKAIGDQARAALAKYKDAKVDMWVWCAGRPKVVNGRPGQNVAPPPYGVSYTQWQLMDGYNLVICAPHLPLVVHEVNHRYLDNLKTIEGIQLTHFHGLAKMGWERDDLGYADLLATYRGVYLYVIRPKMWERFSLAGPASAKPQPFEGKLYAWSDVGDDCWFRLPLLTESNLATLTGLPGLKIVADPKARWRQVVVPAAERRLLRSPYVEAGSEADTSPNNVLSLAKESCAVLHTNTGHWLIVRPEVAEVYVEMLSGRGRGEALKAAGWINEGINPLIVLRAPPDLPVPSNEIAYFR